MPTKPKKPARKPAAKKPAAVDYKKKYEALLNAAKEVSQQVTQEQIECICDYGRQAIGDLRRAAGIAVTHTGAEVTIRLHKSPVPISCYSDEKWGLTLNGVKIPDADFEVDVIEDSEEC